ncbi:FHA domain-containing protein [Eggerthellaceae bacterium zg-1084]|uniref:FHA domain-containing protein n=1 Tax=Berryella wangjianweii TaxID=2734634 RepID=A0A6M8J7W4_9ACTN|nr:FHA domain-containing protein [Berryella wangjianweii]NPD30275.1 FHA domain-containing protein [Berryella wangjianweii]NPD32578.1 FHA domain-containing protein [Eggerthellaceae bacterium zg-997]QKF06962.1 FHA domain-containing protein [Berryella wangjianweii]
MSTICPICNNPVQPVDSSCPSCGFRLNGSTESFAPVELTGSIPAVEPARSAGPGVLKVVRGPRTGATIELFDGELTIGRDPASDVFLNDMTVSRRHATLSVSGPTAQIADQNSFNGVWVNNRTVSVASLQPGDKIQIGEFCLVYLRG